MPQPTSSHCRRCGSSWEPHTAAAPGCTVCSRYDSLTGNAKKVRRDGSTPGVQLSRTGFATWFAAQPRRCTYCSVPEVLLYALGVRTQVGHLLQRLGLDRLDPTHGYALGNLALCCFACNKVKSNTFDTAEMRVLGHAVSLLWHKRLEAVGIHWVPRAEDLDG